MKFVHVERYKEGVGYSFGFILWSDSVLHQALVPLARRLSGYMETDENVACAPLGGHDGGAEEVYESAVACGMPPQEVAAAFRAVWPAYIEESKNLALAYARLGSRLWGADGLNHEAIGQRAEARTKKELEGWNPPCPV